LGYFAFEMTPNERAFLDLIAWSEIGPRLLAATDNGYNVLVGSTPDNPMTFDSYADHPRKAVQLRPGLVSTAAGRYQVLERFFDAYRVKLGLQDFTPASQDAIALQQIRERGALPAIEAGDIEHAVTLCAGIWASLPGNNYGQHVNRMDDLMAAYKAVQGAQS
jgi:muramidase (phage lysozyme)